MGPVPDGRAIAVSLLATNDGFLPARQVIPQMKTIDRYIGSSFLRSFGLVVIILVVLFSFLELLSQLNDVGKGNYLVEDVFLFIGLTLPRRMLDLMPISTLLGSVVALGLLADHGELLAMQAGGISVQRICWESSVKLLIASRAFHLRKEVVALPLIRPWVSRQGCMTLL